MSIILKYEIVRRANSRRISYSWTDVQRLLNRHQLTYSVGDISMLVSVTKTVETREEAIAFRTVFERELRSIHRNIAYSFTVASKHETQIA
jgi:hypothetical protein